MGEETENKVVQKESVKLTKNSKGYTWEIKIFVEPDDKITLERLDKLNNQLLQTYGVEL